jgi:iron complex transport system ATP-binding protein
VTESALSVHDLCVTRNGARVLDRVSFEARTGEVLAVLGPNGAGKSTLLRAVAGIHPSTGRVAVGGRDAAGLDPRERARLLAYLPQRSLLDAPLLVERVVGQGRYARAPGLGRLAATDRDAIEQAMRATGVARLRDRAFTALSYGEQRRVLLARALATEAPLLLLDEPAAALDIAHALGLFATLRGLAEAGRAIVVVVHQLDDARRHADRGLLLREGTAHATGAVRDVLSAANVAQVWGVGMRENEALAFHLEGSVHRGEP